MRGFITMRGNVNRTRALKCQPKKKKWEIKPIVNTVVQLCEPCQDVIQEKIKLNKYKNINQPKICSKCQEKVIKHASHSVCGNCSKKLGVCGKCGKKTAILVPGQMDRDVVLLERAAIEKDIKTLCSRISINFDRHVNQLKRLTLKERKAVGAMDELMAEEEDHNNDSQSILPLDDYIRQAKAKLEELLGYENNDDFDDDDYSDKDCDSDNDVYGEFDKIWEDFQDANFEVEWEMDHLCDYIIWHLSSSVDLLEHGNDDEEEEGEKKIELWHYTKSFKRLKALRLKFKRTKRDY